MKTKISFLFALTIFTVSNVTSQSNNLSSSPYSIYGLGVNNNSNTGRINSMGKTGIAMPTDHSINNLNPASFATIGFKSFLFEIGAKIEKETLFEDGIKENRFNGNFSNIAFAFSLNKKSGIGLTLIPFTNVGYNLVGLESNVEGTTESTFMTNINGQGGLNELRLSYGYAITPKLRLGINTSALFGTIEENEISNINGTQLTISDKNYYSGIRLGIGAQWDINDYVSIGSTINFPTTLKGTKESSIFLENQLQEQEEESLTGVKLPLELGFGIHTQLYKGLSLNADYKTSFWESTNQTDYLGDYIDEHFIGIGMQYIPKKNSLKYWKNIEYRLGVNYSTGNIEVNHQNIKNNEYTLGFGLPLNLKKNSKLNIGYSFGQKGLVENGLIKENYHLFTINLNLSDIWFQKRKYN